MRIQINDQEKEFVNEVSENLYEMRDTEQHITSYYRTIKDSWRKSPIKDIWRKSQKNGSISLMEYFSPIG